MNKWPVSGRSSEIKSQPVDINNNNLRNMRFEFLIAVNMLRLAFWVNEIPLFERNIQLLASA
jgi:hypothetical protein